VSAAHDLRIGENHSEVIVTLALNPKITKAGLALMPTSSGTGFSVTITHVALGTGLYALDDSVRDFVMLRGEVARFAVTSGSKISSTSIQIGTTITDTDIAGRTPNGKSIGEIGFYSGATLWAVWSRADSALFIKSSGIEIPFAYTLDVSAFPNDSVSVTVSTDPAGMAALILQHEAKSDPHPQYATDADVAALTAVVGTKQPNLGFTPTQQGGGIGQATNKVYVGLASDASGVKVTVDKTDFGKIAFLDSPAFTSAPTAPTPAASDNSTRLSTTAYVTSAISTALVGSMVWEARTSARAGWLKLNGTLLSRTAYPALWAYAQASGALVTESQWNSNSWGCFSSGDGASTFRIPDLRGEHIRSWDDGRGADANRAIGTFQASQNLAHAHGASATAVGDHAHSAWTDTQGWHGHGVTDPGHAHGYPPGGWGQAGADNGGITGTSVANQYGSRASQSTYGAATGISINGDGSHGHNVGIGNAGAHNHTITVNTDGGSEARGRNVALLAMIRYL
jgi:microcystin-dependent protein